MSNIPAQHLYRQFGFGIVAIREKYYMDDREDAYVFKLSNLGKVNLCIDRAHHTNPISKLAKDFR